MDERYIPTKTLRAQQESAGCNKKQAILTITIHIR